MKRRKKKTNKWSTKRRVTPQFTTQSVPSPSGNMYIPRATILLLLVSIRLLLVSSLLYRIRYPIGVGLTLKYPVLSYRVSCNIKPGSTFISSIVSRPWEGRVRWALGNRFWSVTLNSPSLSPGKAWVWSPLVIQRKADSDFLTTLGLNCLCLLSFGIETSHVSPAAQPDLYSIT